MGCNVDKLKFKLYNLVKSYEEKQVILKTNLKRAADGVMRQLCLR